MTDTIRECSDEVLSTEPEQAEPYASEEVRVRLVDSISELSEQLVEARQEALTARQVHQQEVALISEKLIDAAETNEMCGTYDAVIDNLNRYLTVKLRVREQDQTLQIRGRIVVDFDRYLDVPLPYNSRLDTDEVKSKVTDIISSLGLGWATQSQPSWSIEIESVDYE